MSDWLSFPPRPALHKVLRALRPYFNQQAELRAAYGGPELLLRSDDAELESDPWGKGEHGLSGFIRANREDGIQFAISISTALHDAGIQHGLELYDSQRELLWQSPLEWNQEPACRR